MLTDTVYVAAVMRIHMLQLPLQLPLHLPLQLPLHLLLRLPLQLSKLQ